MILTVLLVIRNLVSLKLNTNRCMVYSKDDLHRERKRTLVHIMNSDMLTTSFNHFSLCCSYDKLMRPHNDMAYFTVESSTGIVLLPSHLNKTMFTIAAFDNFDHDEGNLSGMDGGHDTVRVLLQDDGDL